MAPRLRIPDRGYTAPKAPPKRNPGLQVRPEAGRSTLKPGTKGPKPATVTNAGEGAASFLGGWKNAVMTAIGMAGPYGAAIATAAGLGESQRGTPEQERQSAPTSGRGAGRASFRDSNNGGRYNNTNNPDTPAEKPGTYTVSGVTYDSKTGQAINPETGKVSSGGYSIDPKSGKRTDYKPGEDRGAGTTVPSAGGSGRGSVRVNPQGVVQEGTDMGGANALLSRLGIDTVQYGQFESNNLPGDQKVTEKPQKTDTDAELTGDTPEEYVNSGESPTNEEELPTKETNIVNSGAQLGSRERYRSEFMADRGNKTGGNSESLVGLRAADASKGLLYASGKYWQEGSDGKFQEISKADYKSIKRGNQHAQEFARDKIELAKAIDTQPTFDDAKKDSKNYDYGTDAGYGGNWTGGGRASEADYPEVSAVSPEDTENPGKKERIDWLKYKKDQGDFKAYIKDDDWNK